MIQMTTSEKIECKSPKKYYECHITIEATPGCRHFIQLQVERLKWKFSAIDGDIILGDGTKFYATRHFNHRLESTEVLDHLFEAARHLESQKIKVIRKKIELVIYDDRSSKVKPCNGGCLECHLDDLKTIG